MIPFSREEREWFLRNLARGLVEYYRTSEPPVAVEEMLNQPPPVYDADFGVVDMYSSLWDATFARPPTHRGSIFVRIDLAPEDRRYALAREMLSALGLSDLLLPHLRDSAEYFARYLLVPDDLLQAYRNQGGMNHSFAEHFQIPAGVGAVRWADD